MLWGGVNTLAPGINQGKLSAAVFLHYPVDSQIPGAREHAVAGQAPGGMYQVVEHSPLVFGLSGY